MSSGERAVPSGNLSGSWSWVGGSLAWALELSARPPQMVLSKSSPHDAGLWTGPPGPGLPCHPPQEGGS